jgi:hypothetical protein
MDYKWTLGADPEVFVQKDKKLISIIGLLGGSKEVPLVLGEGFKAQEDNVAAEYNIPPAETKEKFIRNILKGQEKIKKILEAKNVSFNMKASRVFPKNQLNHPKALEFGCDPDFDAWERTVNAKPQHENPGFRSCGGHIHIGMPAHQRHNVEEVVRIIKAMDHNLGVWSVIVDKDNERRKLYGKAGSFRFQPHGCEYRTLSNFWIWNENLIGEVWDRTIKALETPLELVENLNKDLITSIINTGDKVNARQYLKAHGLT